MQPALSLIAIAVYMGFKLKKGQGFFQEMLEEIRPQGPRPPPIMLWTMERNLTIFFAAYGIIMGILAVWFSTSVWAFFKTAGFLISFAVFMIYQTLLNRKLSKT